MTRFRFIVFALALLPTLPAPASPDTAQPGDYRLKAPFVPFNPIFYSCEDRIEACSSHRALKAVWVGDMNGDGRDDVVTSPSLHNAFWILLQKADGTLEMTDYRVLQYAENVYTVTKAVALGDFNEDGAMDLVSNVPETYFPGMVMLLSDGKGGHTVEHRDDPDGGLEFRRIFARDVDHDGHMDLVALGISAKYPGPGLSAVVQFGDGAGAFPRNATTFFPDASVVEMQMADFDGDGNDDIAAQTIVGFPGEEFLAISYHNGTGGFGPLVVTDQAFETGVAIGDFDADGGAEITEVDEARMLTAVSIAGNRATSREPMAGIAGLHPFRFLARDLDLDGRVDLYSEEYLPGTRQFATVRLQLAEGWTQVQGDPYDGPFLPDNSSNHLDGYASGDINGDGCTDVVTANSQSGLAFYFGSHCMQTPPLLEVTADCGILWSLDDGSSPAMVPHDHGWRAAVADFDGDGERDLLWHGPGRDEAVFWPGGRSGDALTIPIGDDRSRRTPVRPSVGTTPRQRKPAAHAVTRPAPKAPVGSRRPMPASRR